MVTCLYIVLWPRVCMMYYDHLGLYCIMATCPGAEHPVRAGSQAELRDGGQGGVPGS